MLEQKQIPLGIFCDLTKAFDCVDHLTLINKLEYYGIRGMPLNWFKSYLNKREMFVRITHGTNTELINYESNRADIQCGVPQGSVLGPTLFIIYINDIVSNFPTVAFSLFADDTSIITHHDNITSLQTISQSAMDGIADWFLANKLALNYSKTQSIIFQLYGNAQDINICVNQQQDICSTDSTKFLGIYIDNRLDWSEHITQLNIKLSKAVFAIYTIKQNINFAVAKQVYFAYFNSILQYGIEFWGLAIDATKTFIIQKRAIRILCGLQSRDSCRTVFKDEKIFTLTNLYIYKVSLLINKNHNLLLRPSDIHKYPTRKQEIIPPKYNYNRTRKGPLYTGIKIYNHLPQNFKLFSSRKFKIELKKLLHQHAFYNLDEYFQTTF